MIKRILIAALPLPLTALLSACGGGGSSGSSTPTPTPTPSSFTPATPQTGDTYNYNQTISYPLLSSDTLPNAQSIYHRITSTNANGTFYINGVDPAENFPYQLDAKRNIQSMQNCTLSPSNLNELPIPRSVGETSSQSVSGSCGLFSSYQVQQSTTIQSYEPITVPAGTFNTLKAQTTSAYTMTPVPLPSSAIDLLGAQSAYATNGVPYTLGFQSIVPMYSYSESKTCWFDVVSGFPVQCQGQRNYQAYSSPYYAKVNYTTQLTSITHAADAAFTLTGKDNNGNAFPWLNLTPGQGNSYTIQSGTQIELDTTQPVTWTINKTESGSNTAVINIPVTTQTTQTRLNISSQLAASSTGNQATVQITASLIADPSQSVTFTLTILP